MFANLISADQGADRDAELAEFNPLLEEDDAEVVQFTVGGTDRDFEAALGTVADARRRDDDDDDDDDFGFDDEDDDDDLDFDDDDDDFDDDDLDDDFDDDDDDFDDEELD